MDSAMNSSIPRIVRKHAQASKTLTPVLRRSINAELAKAGMDGNGRFDRVGNALASIAGILDKYQLEWDTTLSSHLFMGNEGRRRLAIAYTNLADLHSPTPISNSLVAITWHLLESEKYEIVAYLS